MNNSGAFVGGACGAIISSLIWVAIGYATGYELGILAVGVGIGCGIGAAIGAKGRAGTSGGVIAGACALVAIVAARYVLVQISINHMIQEAAAQSEYEIPGPHDGEYWVAFIADRLLRDAEQTGQELDWSETGYDEDNIATAYPPEIWAHAQATWNGFSMAEREEFCALGAKAVMAEDVEGIEDFRGVASVIGVLVSNFRPMALILMALAVSTAFKVARDSRPKNDMHDGEFAMASAGGATAMEPPSYHAGLPGMPPPSPAPQRNLHDDAAG